MTAGKKPLEVIFEPGCFDDFEGTQEELDELVAEITHMFQSGEFVEHAVPLSEEEIEELLDDETDSSDSRRLLQ